MGEIIKAAWDCEHCGRKDIPGDVRHCPGCGAPVGENVKYHRPRVEEKVDRRIVPKGPDWQCIYCGSYNRYEAAICSNCGADKNGTKDYFGNDVVCGADNGEEPTEASTQEEDSYYGSSNYYSSEHYSSEEPDFEDSFGDLRSGLSKKIGQLKDKLADHIGIAATVLFAIVIIGGLIALAVPREKEFTVTDMSWSRTFYIEKYSTVRDEGWSAPYGSRIISSTLKVHHYDQVEDGYTYEEYEEQVFDGYEVVGYDYVDLGNGYMEKKEIKEPKYRTETRTRQVTKYKEVPVKQPWYVYEEDKYVQSRTMTAEASDKSPYWPENPPVEQKNPKIGDERVGSRQEIYYAKGFVTDKPEKTVTYKMSPSDWKKVNVGDTVKCKVTLLTGHMTLMDYEEEEEN